MADNGTRPWRTRTAVRERASAAAEQRCAGARVAVALYAVQGGYEARDAVMGPPSGTHELLGMRLPESAAQSHHVGIQEPGGAAGGVGAGAQERQPATAVPRGPDAHAADGAARKKGKGRE